MEIPRCILAAGDDDGAYECTCVPGWRGLTCEHPTGCDENPCGSHGTCRYWTVQQYHDESSSLSLSLSLPHLRPSLFGFVCYCLAFWAVRDFLHNAWLPPLFCLSSVSLRQNFCSHSPVSCLCLRVTCMHVDVTRTHADLCARVCVVRRGAAIPAPAPTAGPVHNVTTTLLLGLRRWPRTSRVSPRRGSRSSRTLCRKVRDWRHACLHH